MSEYKYPRLSVNAHQLIYYLGPVLGAVVGAAAPILFVTQSHVHVESGGAIFLYVLFIIAGFVGGIIFAREAVHWIPVACPECGAATRMDVDEKGYRKPRIYSCDNGHEHISGFDPARIFGGLAFSGAGLFIIVFSFFIKMSESESQWPMILFGLVFVTAGLLIMGLAVWVLDWARKRYAWVSTVDWNTIFGGAIALAIGLALILIARFDPRDDAFPSGRGAVYAAGGVFALAGVAIVMPKLLGAKMYRIVGPMIAALLLSAFASVPVMIAINEGGIAIFFPITLLGLFAGGAWVFTFKRILEHAGKQFKDYKRGFVIAVTVLLLLGVASVAAYRAVKKPGNAAKSYDISGSWDGDGDWKRIEIVPNPEGGYAGTFSVTYGNFMGKFDLEPEGSEDNRYSGKWSVANADGELTVWPADTKTIRGTITGNLPDTGNRSSRSLTWFKTGER